MKPVVAQRHHWLNTYVGMLDAAFALTDEEQVYVAMVVADLLDALNIPGRGEPDELPPGVALEVSAGYYTVQISGRSDSHLSRSPRSTGADDIVVSVEAWTQAFVNMLMIAYPALEPIDRIAAAKGFSDLLVSLGVPARAANWFPDDVVRAYRDVDSEEFLGIVS